MSTARTTVHRSIATARRRMRARRDVRAFARAYDQASPSMQAELLVLAQRQHLGS